MKDTDDTPQDAATWKLWIGWRRRDLIEARGSGDRTAIARAEERLNSALDGYSRDCR